MIELEKKLGLRSSFYFLEKNNGYFDSLYIQNCTHQETYQ